MNGCLNERALLALHCGEENPKGRSHLRFCADCAERYDTLAEDLEFIETTLNGPPPARTPARGLPLRPPLLAVAALSTFAAAVIGIIALYHSTPPQTVARRATLSAFASDVSEAVFANPALNDLSQVASDTPYARAAREADWPCTQDRFLEGECTDQLTALLFEDN